MKIQDSIRSKIEKAFAPLVHLELENESHQHASGPHAETHFKLILASEAFEGMDRVSRQRKIMDNGHHRRALLRDPSQQIHDDELMALIKGRRGLICDQHRCFGGQRAGDGDARTFPA